MATLLGQKRVGTVSIRSTRAGPVLEETWEFIVQADSALENRIQVAESVGLVPGFSVVESIAVLRSLVGTQREDNPLIWDFVADFSSEVEEGQLSTVAPEEWVPVYRTKFERLTEAASKDQAGTVIANSAGQPFEVGIMISRFIPIWEFYQFEPSSITDETIIERNELVNSASFKGRAAKSLLCTVLSSEIGFYYGQRRRLTQYQLKYNEKLWTHKRQDTGTVYKDGSDLKAYTDADGNVILGGLNGSGAKQTVGNPPALLEFDIYRSGSFSFLRI